ncbi:membrane protein [Escherichia coli]|nr:membrane protein [Escherichia coli]
MLFPRRKPEVRLLKNTAAGVIFSVKSGKGFLRQCVIYDPHSHGLIHSLCWQGCPVNTFLVRGWLPYLCGICLQRFCGG